MQPATPTACMGQNRNMRVLALLLLAGSTYAQTLTLNLDSEAQALSFSVQMKDVSVERIKLNFGVSLAPTPQIRAAFRNSRSFGPIGNLQLSGSASVSNHGEYFVDLSGQAAFGSIAGKVTIAVGNTTLRPFSPKTRFPLEPPASGFLTAHWQQVSFKLDYRPSRVILLNLSPSVFRTTSNFGGFIRTEAHFYRAFGNHNLEFEAEGLTNHPQKNDYFNLGATFVSSPRHYPSWQLAFTAGGNSDGLILGTRLKGTHYLRNQTEIVVSFSSEPYKADSEKYRLSTELILPLNEPGFSLQLGSGLAKMEVETVLHTGIKLIIDLKP